ncbi:threonine-phosphate decarboxylase CobD [Aerosakkonemataceae cyanobacterium BLCC-F154]|uniref:threonine-phosphate decarboxylase n=1 Tax=Floridaenema fluviatile BLCC-F154 TaxID=3153640 RepID=A0ABV4Y691_9CYAN
MFNRPLHGGNIAWAAALAGCSPDAILDFSASINPLGPPESAIAAIKSHLPNLKAYPDPDYHQLRASLSAVHQVPPDWILPGNGSAELLTWAGWELSELDRVFLIVPAFGDYWRTFKGFNANVVEYPLLSAAGEVVNLEFLDGKKQTLSSFNNGLLLNNPHNPTGKLFFQEAILPLLEMFALVVVDEAFMDFLPPDREQSLIPWVSEFPNLVILRSLTKFYSLPGLRLGYAIAHPERLQRWQAKRDPWPVNVLAAAAAEAAIADRVFQQQTWNWLQVSGIKLFQGLAELPGLKPYESAANFLLVKSAVSTSLLQEKLLKESQILIRDCLSFPELGDRYFRVAVRWEKDNQRLITELAKVLSKF